MGPQETHGHETKEETEAGIDMVTNIGPVDIIGLTDPDVLILRRILSHRSSELESNIKQIPKGAANKKSRIKNLSDEMADILTIEIKIAGSVMNKDRLIKLREEQTNENS